MNYSDARSVVGCDQPAAKESSVKWENENKENRKNNTKFKTHKNKNKTNKNKKSTGVNYAEASMSELLVKSEQISYADAAKSGQPVKCPRLNNTDTTKNDSQVKSHSSAADVGQSGPSGMSGKLSYADAAKGE